MRCGFGAGRQLAAALLVVACSNSPKDAAGSGGAGGSAATGGVAGAAGAAGSQAGLGPPKIGNVFVNGALDGDGKSVVLTVDVTDPDGLGDIAGGKLYSSDKSHFFGPFSQVSAGTFTYTIDWTTLNDVQPVVFAKGGSTNRTLLIEFADSGGHTASVTQSLTLSCANCSPLCLACGTCTQASECNMCDPTGQAKTCAEFCSSVGMKCACAFLSCQNLSCLPNACDSPCPSGSACACSCN